MGLTLAALFLTFLSFVVNVLKYVLDYEGLSAGERWFSVDGEGTVSAYYSAGMLLLCSILLARIAFLGNEERRPYRLHWGMLSFIFLFLSFDEAFMVHERTTPLVRLMLADLGLTLNLNGLLGPGYPGIPHKWVIPYAFLVLALVLAYARFLVSLDSNTRRLFLISGAVYVAGALGMEIVGDNYAPVYGARDLTHIVIFHAEELLEMIGAVMFIYALTSYINSCRRQARFVQRTKPLE